MKGYTTTQLFLIVAGTITVIIVVYLLLLKVGIFRQETWTTECLALQKSYCAEWQLSGFSSDWKNEHDWDDYAKGCPDKTQWIISKTSCEEILTIT